MASFNRIIIAGNLTRDPEYKQLTSGQSVCRLGLASNRQFKNRQTGDTVQEVCFVDIDVWGAQAESCRQYLSKGRAVLIEGRLKLDSWEDQTGQTRSKHSIVADRVVFLSGPQAVEEDSSTSYTTTTPAQNQSPVSSAPKFSSAPVKQPVKAPKKFEPAPEPQSAENQALEKELFDQIQQIKKRTQVASQPMDTGEMNFKDEPPFQDDLPF